MALRAHRRPSKKLARGYWYFYGRHVQKITEHLEVGDLVLWVGKPSEYATFHRRLVYQIVEIVHLENSAATCSYRLRPAFDIENPIGCTVETTGYPVMSAYLKKLTLLDVGIIRLKFDSFIKEWAKNLGMNITHMPTDSDISANDK